VAVTAFSLGEAARDRSLRRVRSLAWLTVGWLVIDGAIGMGAGLAADSVALIGWGLDCAVQAAGALVVIWRFTGSRIDSRTAERVAQRAVGVSYLLLAPYIVVVAADHLLAGRSSGASWLGIALAATDAILMPIVFQQAKRAGTPPSAVLMPLAFGSLLGGLMTLIGTSRAPNADILIGPERRVGMMRAADLGGETDQHLLVV